MDGDQAAGTARESAAGAAAAGPGYRRREPERSLLYETVRSYWNTLLAEVAQRTDGGSLPRSVVAEFERYLSCGILANGFARVHCDACGKDMLVANEHAGRSGQMDDGCRRANHLRRIAAAFKDEEPEVKQQDGAAPTSSLERG